MNPSFAALVLAVGCRSSYTLEETRPLAAHEGIVEGHVRDSLTGLGSPGLSVELQFLHKDQILSETTVVTDERGYFMTRLQPGNVSVQASYVATRTRTETVTVRAGYAVRLALEIDHAALDAAKRRDPPATCPSSPPGAMVRGHTTTAADRDAVAASVLSRFARDRTTIHDHEVVAGVSVNVRTRSNFGALPRGFTARTAQDLEGEAERTGARVSFIHLDEIYSDGTCALVGVGVDYVVPRAQEEPGSKRCCCSQQDIYEKRGAQWVFVRQVFASCA